MRYLLDTTLIADHANGYPPAVELLNRLFDEGAELFTCDVVVCEAQSGGTREHQEAVVRLLEPLEFVATNAEAAAHAGASRLRRHRSGGKLGLGDALIAGVANELGAMVVTRNRPDFQRQRVSVLTY